MREDVYKDLAHHLPQYIASSAGSSIWVHESPGMCVEPGSEATPKLNTGKFSSLAYGINKKSLHVVWCSQT